MKKIIPIFIFLMGFSCSDESIHKEVDNSPQDLVTLSFNSSEEMSAYVLNAKNGTNPTGRESSSSKFQSINDIYKNALESFSVAETHEEIARLLKTYGDVVELSDSTFLPKLKNEFYRTICNREGIYESEGFAHKVIDDQFIIVTKKENLKALRKIKSLDNLDQALFKLIAYNGNGFNNKSINGRTLSDACANNMEYSYYYDPSGCKNDRKVYIAAGTWWVISGNDFTPWLASRTWGRRRAGTLCFWYGYSTILNYRGAYFDVKIVINGITRHFILNNVSIPDYYGTLEESEKQIWNDFLTGPITWQGGTPPAISFTRAFVEASSRGTNNNWVSVDCIGPQ
jgi:hypothetical protein